MSVLGKKGATPHLPREALKTRLNQIVQAWGLTPTLRGDSCLFLSPYPLDDGPVAWRCKRAGGWGLAANVSSVRARVADPLLQPGPTSQLGQSRVQGFQHFFDPSILVRLL